jgi:SM-20-related protein
VDREYPDPAALERLLDRFAAEGHAVQDDWLPDAWITALAAAAERRAAAGELKPARIGRGSTLRRATAVRGDRIAWLDPEDAEPAVARLLTVLEALRVACNRRTWLGLFELEAHFAHYPPGTGYARHCDSFVDGADRVLSVVLYLNPDWRPDDGGELILYPATGPVAIEPRAGRLVVFGSAELEHEVRPARRDRYSIAGWFRRRPLGQG